MRRAAIALTILCCGMLSGCLEAVQADDYMYVVGVGFDKGKGRKYEISFLVQKEVGGEGQSSTGGAEVLSAEGDSIFDAITTLHAGGPFRINFSRVNTLMFSRELAEEGEIRQLADIAFNALKLRQSVKLLVSMCPAKEFLEGLSSAQIPNVTKLQFSMFENYTVEGITLVTNYSILMESIRDQRMDGVMMLGGIDHSAVQNDKSQQGGGDGENQPDQSKGEGQGGGSEGAGQAKENGQSGEQQTTAGVRRSGGMSAYISGAALFDGWEMKGTIDGEDTKYLLMARGDFVKGKITVPYGRDAAVIYLKNPDVPKVELTLGDTPKAQVELKLVCGMLQYMGDYRKDEWELGLKAAAEEYIAGEIQRVFEMCRGLNSDAMGFGRYASMQFSDTVAWEEYDWKRYYPGMEAEFRVNLELADENIVARME